MNANGAVKTFFARVTFEWITLVAMQSENNQIQLNACRVTGMRNFLTFVLDTAAK